MKAFKIVLTAVSIAALASCASSKYISEGSIESISDAVVITPHTDLVFLEDSKTVLEMPEETAQMSDYIIKAIAESGIPVTEIVRMDVYDSDIEEALFSLNGIKPKQFRTQTLPSALDQVLENRGYRYGVFTLSDGYLSSKQYFRKRAVRSAVIGIITGILTLGTFYMYEDVEKYAFNLCIIVADSETDKIVFYNRRFFNGWDPTDATKVEKAVKKLMKDFRQTTHNPVN